jgi:hypothetical protein
MTLYSTEFHFASGDGSRAACMGPWTVLHPFDRARAEHGISCLNSMFFEYSDVIDGWHFPGPDS